jgi:hypothetical protein
MCVILGAVPERSLEIVQRWTSAYNGRDMSGITALTDPGFEFRSVFVALESSFRGHEGLQLYFTQLDDAYQSFQVVPSDLLDAGDAVLMTADACWRGKGSGATGATPIFVAFRLKGGKVHSVETFTDRGEALIAVGAPG